MSPNSESCRKKSLCSTYQTLCLVSNVGNFGTNFDDLLFVCLVPLLKFKKDCATLSRPSYRSLTRSDSLDLFFANQQFLQALTAVPKFVIMDIDNDLNGIANLMRRHIEIRNRSWMKRIHRDCFVGSEAVDFLVMQGFADTRKAAVEIGVKMNTRKLIRNITESRKFSDSLHYYRFFDDDQPTAALNKMNAGHVPGGSCLGNSSQLLCSFTPERFHPLPITIH